ncbi:hypothetical protein OG921_03050 [Aldersonia sp. NBC_00410]|uniref:hypothetical protein n=1 Tax=Aldersonia sp. NBC_00410 TaxID=2975954 RepID=UPI00225A1155|nr:hypothetical protein [Aldersonia sp. NBC_00410]MCX5042169.1 hypothetical protein [Aldersonia sp. NBC_00410]
MSGARMTVLAHGLGGSSDLPIPYTYALIGAAWALTASFVVVAFAWKRPRFDAEKPGKPLPQWVSAAVDSPVLRWGVAIVALLFAVWVVIAAFFGPQSGENALPGVFYVLLWVGLVFASVLFGPVWRVISPVRTVHRMVCLVSRRDPHTARVQYPVHWGYWPAVVGLFAFVWLELASPEPASQRAIESWLLVYVVVTLGGAVLCGDRWLARADPFDVYSVVASRLSPLRRGAGGAVGVGNPFDHLLTLPVRPGIVAVLSVLLGSTAFDSFSAMPQWRSTVDDLSDAVPASLVRTVGLLVFVAVVWGTFTLATRATGGLTPERRRKMPGLMAHSLIPIVVGYIFAHYLSYLVERGQQTVIRLADPLDRGWNLLGLGDLDVNYVLSQHPSVLATIKVCCVLGGHIAGVVAAHDRSLRLLPKGYQLTGQLALMVTMVGYTFTGLYLLFGG